MMEQKAGIIDRVTRLLKIKRSPAVQKSHVKATAKASKKAAKKAVRSPRR